MGHSRNHHHRCSWLVLAVCCQVSQAATQAIQQIGSAPLLQIAPYQQCGGSAGCPNSVACSDAAWPGYVCPDSYVCTRFDQYWWQCRRPGDMAVASAAATQQQQQPQLTAYAWSQCGGSLCPPYITDTSICSDAVWATCPAGLTCIRRDQWYYQCRDTAFPESSAGTSLSAYAWSQCGGSLCPSYITDTSICSDAVWATCPAGLTCMRRDQWYYQCRDKPFPESSAAAPAVTGGSQQQQQQQQQQVQLTAYAWSQCGGSLCPDYITDTSICSDAAWATCPTGLTCMRRDQWYYQCRDTAFPASPAGTSLSAYAWSQCGGSLCPPYITDTSICSDAVWATCPAGLTCMRRDQWYYQCRDKPFPESSAVAPADTGGSQQQQQQQVQLTAYAWSQCGGSLCPDYIPDKSICGDKAWATCPAGLTCIRSDQWYYQCRDKPFPETSAPPPPALSMMVQGWAQCGGATCPGLQDQSICGDKVWAKCPVGHYCYRRNPWYWQCRDRPFFVPAAATASAATPPAAQYRATDPVVTEVPDGALDTDVEVVEATRN